MDPQELNRYSYVRNSPANLVDPRGDVTLPAEVQVPVYRSTCLPTYDPSCNPVCPDDPTSMDCVDQGSPIVVTPDPCSGGTRVNFTGATGLKCPNIIYTGSFTVTRSGGINPPNYDSVAPPIWTFDPSPCVLASKTIDPANPFRLMIAYEIVNRTYFSFHLNITVDWMCNGQAKTTGLGIPLRCLTTT